MGEVCAVTALSPLRKVIAARMTEAARIPHFRLVADLEADAILVLRSKLQERYPNAHLTITDLLIKACGMALMDIPDINIQFAEGNIRQFHTADIAVMTAIEGGVSTPIVRSVDSKTVWEISREVKALRARAAKNELKMEEVFGGSFSVSNLGMYGVDQFDAILNIPQCAILALGSVKVWPVATDNNQMHMAAVLRTTLSVDHRVIDGATAARFLSALRRRVEQPQDLIG